MSRSSAARKSDVEIAEAAAEVSKPSTVLELRVYQQQHPVRDTAMEQLRQWQATQMQMQ